MLEKHDLRTELGRLCVDAMRDRNAFMGPSANIYTACESRLHDTSTPERTSQAAELYRVLRKAEAPFGNLPMFSPLAEHAIRLSDALAAAGKLDEAVELCGDGRMGCESLFQSRLKADDLDGAARVYRAVRGTTFGAPGLFTPAGKYRQQLIQALAEKGRGGEASALCEFSDSDCDRNIETLLQAGKQKEALEFASLRSMNGGYSLDFIASTSSSLSVEDRTALQILAARRAGNTYNLERFLAGQAYGGNVDEVGAALRKFGAGMELGKFSMHSDGDALMQMAYQGYLSARITFSTRLVDRSCLVTGPTVGYGEVLRLAFTGKAACNEGAFVEALVEHGGRVWGIDQNAVTFVVSEPDIPTRPLKQLTLAEVLPRMTANGVEADAELLDEVTLGIAAEKDILEKHKLYTDAEATAAGTAAFRKLMETSFARAGNVPSFQLLLLNEGSPNAFSTAGGRVFVNRGMLPLIQNQPGMWAAVIAHEVGHVVAHHQYKHYVRTVTLAALQRELARQAATGNKVATWGWIFSRTGGPLLNMKFGRDEELEADRLGMMMMAEAGYHPNYILALMQNLRHEVGEHGKVGTFFSSDHPRWETREKKAKQAYEEALDKFRAKWADVEKSPGGIPPQVQ